MTRFPGGYLWYTDDQCPTGLSLSSTTVFGHDFLCSSYENWIILSATSATICHKSLSNSFVEVLVMGFEVFNYKLKLSTRAWILETLKELFLWVMFWVSRVVS